MTLKKPKRARGTGVVVEKTIKKTMTDPNVTVNFQYVRSVQPSLLGGQRSEYTVTSYFNSRWGVGE